MDSAPKRRSPCRLGMITAARIPPCPQFCPSPRQSPQDGKKGQPELIVPTGLLMSGRLDSNQRPPEPHSGALAKLRHAPAVSESGGSVPPVPGRATSGEDHAD